MVCQGCHREAVQGELRITTAQGSRLRRCLQFPVVRRPIRHLVLRWALVTLWFFHFPLGGFAQSPSISKVKPFPVVGANFDQQFMVYGKNFHPKASVILRDKRTGERFDDLEFHDRTSDKIEISANFTAKPAPWTVEVVNPGGAPSREFKFEVVAPEIIPKITGVLPDPAPGLNQPHHFTINGHNFVKGCEVILTDRRTGEVFENIPLSMMDADQITIRPIFTITEAQWSVRVVNPGGYSSDPYTFDVIPREELPQQARSGSDSLWLTVGLGLFGVTMLGINVYQRFWHLPARLEAAGEHARRDQKRYLAGSLHDGVGSHLMPIVHLCRHARRQHDEPHARVTTFDQIESLVKEIQRYVSDLSWVSDSDYFAVEELLAKCREKANQVFNGTELELSFEFPLEEVPYKLSAETCEAVLFGFAEGLNNILKHSRATHVTLSASLTEWDACKADLGETKQLQISISDNGIGIKNLRFEKSGQGLRNMRDRLEAVGGQCAIRSQLNEGTQIHFMIPLRCSVDKQRLRSGIFERSKG